MYRIQGADHKEYGPATADQLRQWIAERRLNQHSLACLDSDGIWKPLGQFPEFAADLAALAAVAPVPPPAPPTLTSPGVPGMTGGEFPADREAAVSQIQGPAIGLIILGAMGLVFSLLGLLSHFAGFDRAPALPSGLDERTQRLIQRWSEFGNQYGAVLNGVSLAFAVVILLAGLKLRRLEGYGLVLAGAILAILPCTNACCCLGLPVGIWVLVAINQPGVKPHFR
ncbi:MAG: GYF domain-containing protein [Verrucomicrobiota bacterium]